MSALSTYKILSGEKKGPRNHVAEKRESTLHIQTMRQKLQFFFLKKCVYFFIKQLHAVMHEDTYDRTASWAITQQLHPSSQVEEILGSDPYQGVFPWNLATGPSSDNLVISNKDQSEPCAYYQVGQMLLQCSIIGICTIVQTLFIQMNSVKHCCFSLFFLSLKKLHLFYL